VRASQKLKVCLMQKSNLIKNFVASDLAKQSFSEVGGSSVRAVFKKMGCFLNNEIAKWGHCLKQRIATLGCVLD